MAQVTEIDRATSTTDETRQVIQGYFDALKRGELGYAQRDVFHDDGVGGIYGVVPEGPRADVVDFYFSVRNATDDFEVELLHLVADGDRATAEWHISFSLTGPGHFLGFAPSGRRLDLRGNDCYRVHDGKIIRSCGYTDYATAARQLGALPARDSALERLMIGVVNLRMTLARRLKQSRTR